jgi:phage gpG-like protein
VTIERFLAGGSSRNFSAKTGKITAQGQRAASGKRPLLGLSGALSTTINYEADDDGVSIGSPMIYAAVQQFGAQAREFGGKAPWGKIPARPFLGLSSEDEASINESVVAFLAL